MGKPYQCPSIKVLGTLSELTLRNKAILNNPDGDFFMGRPLTTVS